MVFFELGVRGGGKEVVADRGWIREGSFLIQDMSYEWMLGVCSQIVVLTRGCAYRW